MPIKTIEYKNGKLKIIDQRKLPCKLVYRNLSSVNDIKGAIKTLAVRGAPAIGVAAAYGVYIGIDNLRIKGKKIFFRKLNVLIRHIETARPTAINLFWALERMRKVAVKNREKPISAIKRLLFNEAGKIQREDEIMCEKIGRFGARLINDKDRILTHCNAGALATAGSGTALSAIYAAKKQGKKIKVYADETRPLLQGARLTTWELMREGIDVTLICDSMAATLMKKAMIDKIIVGADRIAANGDFANKIGTYNLALLSMVHKIPFYCFAPSSSFDFSIKNGESIPIEQRDPDEVRKIKDFFCAPKKVKVYNPAFDVTPHELVTAFITEKGVFRKPYMRSLKSLKGSKS
ncbi:MAG: S-methyl-5-thioribose-1-phosphate isomerase [Candidatus Omnitrophota bacterium]|nr:MAG: S-methyl-5-thioribose-1-phosphate isomerase [Candidatus Omnitrophota bacterium]